MATFSPTTAQNEASVTGVARGGQGLLSWRERWWKEISVFALLLLVLAAPWVLRPKNSAAPSRYDRRLVILTPHNEKIRQEFGGAFTRLWKQQTGEVLYMDWRTGATGELAMVIRSDYSAAFQHYWTTGLNREWSHVVAQSFGNPKIKVPADATDETLALPELVRKTFLESNVGIQADLFFGGGAIDFDVQAKAGTLVASDASGRYGVAPLMVKHPVWFDKDHFPAMVSGEPYYDREKRWVGNCLSALGIVYNKDVLKRLGVERAPDQWEDLADPRLRGFVAMSDPNKSGTVTKALEQIIQQQMQICIEELREAPAVGMTNEEVVQQGVSKGWERGWQLIQRISANSRYFTDAATKIPLDVAQGEAAAGMAIDFYGRSFEEQVRKADGTTRVAFVAPLGGTSIGVDPIALLRGAPEPEVAMAFMEFVLSDDGQRLWNFRVGSPGGPQQTNLRRLPVRRDFYTDENRRWMVDAQADPYEEAKAFTYHPEWTGSLFTAVRFLMRAVCLDVHEEQKAAWEALARAGFPPRATALFADVQRVNYREASALAGELARKDKEMEMRKARELAGSFRAQYLKAAQLARQGL